jgi:protein-export membrane protein SecD
VGEVRNVGAQLGKDSIRQGTLAALIGAIIVMLYMSVWYKLSGVIANVALFANVLMILAALALFGATLTLPGIAGIALTVGMAVDANIIIYERIREELRAGAIARKAVDAGFENATSAILDSNITTAIAGVVLYTYGTGPIRGFAVTLLIGIATTLISALYVTRSLLELATRSSTTRLSI